MVTADWVFYIVINIVYIYMHYFYAYSFQFTSSKYDFKQDSDYKIYKKIDKKHVLFKRTMSINELHFLEKIIEKTNN